MTEPEVVRCPDKHYRRAIYEIGPFIADYPEQVVLAGIVQGWCPKYVLLLFSILMLSDTCLQMSCNTGGTGRGHRRPTLSGPHRVLETEL